MNLCVVIFLDGFDVEAAVFERLDGLGGGYRTGNGCEIGARCTSAVRRME